eukprot:TRINITY_DN27487_c0_g1_i1.p1 TRINITY_DN27487_c0_g1~~TRINITY_DN27487_c0_g1_i1.p1  ORF type:complete len:412 (+),score=123.32 TRINITY_DN27487_c0_g1_i1:95-1330(+)
MDDSSSSTSSSLDDVVQPQNAHQCERRARVVRENRPLPGDAVGTLYDTGSPPQQEENPLEFGSARSAAPAGTCQRQLAFDTTQTTIHTDERPARGVGSGLAGDDEDEELRPRERRPTPPEPRGASSSSGGLEADDTTKTRAKLQHTIAEQEKRIKGMMGVLQNAACEIKRERTENAELRKRLDAAEALAERRRKSRRAEAETPPRQDDPALVALRVENDCLRAQVKKLSGVQDAHTTALGELRRCREELTRAAARENTMASTAAAKQGLIDSMAGEIAELQAAVAQLQPPSQPARPPPERAPRDPPPPRPRDETTALATRMKRALAPPPDPSALGILVDSMVKELRRAWKGAHGADLALIKRARGVYAYRDQRLNLEVVDGKLAYRAGGGHKDLIAFLERKEAALRQPMMP